MSSLSNYDLIFFGVSGLFILMYGYTLWLNCRGNRDGLFVFRTITVSYFIFFSVLLAKYNYEGIGLSSASFNPFLWCLLLYYTAIVLSIASLFNIRYLNRKQLIFRKANRLNRLVFIVIFFKILLFVYFPTPLQGIMRDGVLAGVKFQGFFHTGNINITSIFYKTLAPLMVTILLLKAKNCKNPFSALVFLILAVETSGWYFSKSGLVVPIIIFLIIKRVSLGKIVLVIGLSIIIVFGFRYNMNPISEKNFSLITNKIFTRFSTETSYSNIHLKLYENETPPLFYEASYFLGFKTLFGIEKKIDVSREAYFIEKKKYGATTSGSAVVFLYGFWGIIVFAITPLLITLIFLLDIYFFKKIRTDFEYIAYLVMTFYVIKVLSTNLHYIISFGSIVSLPFLFNILPIIFVSIYLRKSSHSALMYHKIDSPCALSS